ncbi:helix-turn-helix domain-containing protein [Insolitispirillum peregrinum]|uniref:Zn-dependent peptidase ImmA, M78 family n=1 Tax=Insolitispirillum peregrinum TaxID=80876 RepID=A0A1N7LMW3_9PROT|nr:XRE family transcriptional regulator [Insolitispirillum peregrinum]SIS75122.1 Zn-dependent peptidase ImmA, M78 family [Insolitispirillum peregrinum]
MRNGTPGFQPGRLVEARDSRGLSQIALANLINRTSSSISRWEGGNQSPEPEALDILARALNLPMSFFLQPQPKHGDNPMFFRSMAITTQALRRRTCSRLHWAEDIALQIQEWLDLPEVDLPQATVSDYREICDEDIESIATECRKRWKLGMGPIADMLLVMENAGVCVVKEEVGSATMDGLSHWSEIDQRPYVLIASDKDACVRSRLDAAHELGHLILHRHVKEKSLVDKASFKEVERQAFLFAGAFLLPAESFSVEVWSPSLNSFLSLKERWKVSIGAMVKRCHALGIVSDEYEQRLWKHYGARGWRKSEPLDDVLTVESPRLLNRSIRLLIDENVRTREQLLDDFHLPASDVESLCGLPRGFMTSTEADLVVLPRIKGNAFVSNPDGEVGISNAELINFPVRGEKKE